VRSCRTLQHDVEVQYRGEVLGAARGVRQKVEDLEEVRQDSNPRAKRQQRGRLLDKAYEELVMEDESGTGDQDLVGNEALHVHDGVAMAESHRAGAGMASPAPIPPTSASAK
jgi:hypothetical protein